MVTWDEVPPIEQNGVISEYEVEVNQTTFLQIAVSALYSISGADRKLIVSALEENVEYTVRVRAVTGGGNGPYSPGASNTTSQDGENFLRIHLFTCYIAPSLTPSCYLLPFSPFKCPPEYQYGSTVVHLYSGHVGSCPSD